MYQVNAYAKVNLSLQIVGKRADGYHLLESIMVFVDLADTLNLVPEMRMSLSVEGPYGSGLEVEANILMKAVHALRTHAARPELEVAMTLHKAIPVGAGLGGGSADAAALLHALNHYWNLNISEETLRNIGLTLGADVPICLYGRPAWVSGVGQEIIPVTIRCPIYLLLVNPSVLLRTVEVFRAYRPPYSIPSTPITIITGPKDISSFRNDLTDAAIAQLPQIKVILKALEELPGCEVARMSGSGATCFGWFYTQEAVKHAEEVLQVKHPDWWIKACRVVA